MKKPKVPSLRRFLALFTVAFIVLIALSPTPNVGAFAGFTQGNLVIYRVGDGTAALGSPATAVFLDEYTPAGTLVQSIALPTVVNGSNKRLTASGSSTSEGLLTLSVDGKYLLATGYDAALATASITTSASATINRVIARVDSSAVVDTTTALSDASTGSNPRSAVSTDGTNMWIDGGAGGIRYTTIGSTTSTQLSTTVTNLRQANIYNGQLYVTDSSGTAVRLGSVGTGTPTTAGQTITNLPGFPVAGSPYGFMFANFGTGQDSVYVADDTGQGIQKYSLVSGNWVLNNVITGTSLRGLTGTVNGNTVTLYITGNGTTLYKLTDTSGYNANNNGSLTTLATAATNTAFRGVAFAPSNGVATPTNPSGIGTATPSSIAQGGSTLFKVTVTPGTNVVSTGLAVTGNLTSIGGSATQQFFDNGTNGDVTAGDNVFSFQATVTAGTTVGGKSIPTTITDAQSRSGNASISLNVTSASPFGTGSATPSTVIVGNNTLLTVTVTPGVNPASTGLAVSADLTSIGGISNQSFFDDGTHGDVTPGDNIFSFTAAVPNNNATGSLSIPVVISDAQSRGGSTSISLQVNPQSTPPAGVVSATPSSLLAGNPTLIAVTVTPGTNPASTGITVTGNLSTIGGSTTQTFFDDGSHGDVTAGDNVFSFTATVPANTAPGSKSLTFTVADAQSRSSAPSISITITPPPPPTTVKISQVYGGGGNSGSTFTNDFIEIFNQDKNPVDISFWSVQYSSNGTTTWTATSLCPSGTCLLQPGHYFLVQESAGAGGTTALPTPDASGAIAMSSSSAKVVLVADTAALSGACPTGGSIVDFVGYGSANTTCFETAPTGTLSNTTAAVRKGNGCTDTDNNSLDFVVVGPIPRNSASPVNSCGTDPTMPSGLGVATPGSVLPASNTVLTVKVTPAVTPLSTGITVTADISSIGGSASQSFFDDGTHGDVTAGDNTFSYQQTVGPFIATGVKNIIATITDAQARSVTAPITMTVQSPTCGVERWSIKTGTDANALGINTGQIIPTTIFDLGQIPAPNIPAEPPVTPRIPNTETTVWQIDGTLMQYKLEADVDYHLVVQDASGHTLIAEIPSPACVGPTSPFGAAVAASRATFDAKLSAQTFFQTANIPVRIQGVGFFDFIHGQTGVAPNGIELHPALAVFFTSSTTTTLQSATNPSVYGQAVQLTATVNSSGGPTPTGNVTFTDGTTSFLGALNGSGVATASTTSLSVGSHSFTANYTGDNASASSSSTTLIQVVNKADQTITFATLASKTYLNADFTVSASSTSNLAVSFGASGNCTVNGATVHITGAGSCTITASQAGDTNFNAATSVPQSFTINKANQAITFGTLAAKTYLDADFNVSATSTSSLTVSFGASGNCTVTVTTVHIMGAGSCTITASQAGDTNFNAATNVPQTFTINKANPVITWNPPAAITYGVALSSTQLNASPSTPGNFVYNPATGAVLAAGTQTLNATFTPTDTTNFNSVTPSVSLTVNKASLTVTANNAARVFGTVNPAFTGTVGTTVNNDVITATYATTATQSSAVGTYNIVPTPAGAALANYNVTPVNGTLTISKAASSTALAINAGATVVYTATVANASSGSIGTPTGTVTFFDGTTSIGSAQLNASGVASTTIPVLSTATHSITAVYGADTNFNGSTSSAAQLVVDYSVTANPSAVVLHAGQSATSTFTVTPTGGFTGPVTFSCSTLPALATCSFSPASLNVAGVPISTTLTITTAGSSASLVPPQKNNNGPLFAMWSAFGLLGIVLMGTMRQRDTKTRTTRVLQFFGLALLLLAIAGCGGGKASTPTGTSSITVTATSGSGSHSAFFVVTIQ